MSEKEHILHRYHPLRSLTRDLQLMLDHVFGETPGLICWEPPCDIYETSGAFLVQVELPGMSREDVEIDITPRLLTIRGQRRAVVLPTGSICHQRERRYGSFQRSILLPTVVDSGNSSAEMKDGLLMVTLPRRETRQIPIRQQGRESGEDIGDDETSSEETR